MIKEWFLKPWIKQERWYICRFGYLCVWCVSSGNPGSMVSARRFHGKMHLRGSTGLPGWLKRHSFTAGAGIQLWYIRQRRRRTDMDMFARSFETQRGQWLLDPFEGLHWCIFTFVQADDRRQDGIYWASLPYCQVMRDMQTIHVTTVR